MKLAGLLAVAAALGGGMRLAPEPAQPWHRPGSASKAADLRKRKAASKSRVQQRMRAKGKRK